MVVPDTAWAGASRGWDLIGRKRNIPTRGPAHGATHRIAPAHARISFDHGTGPPGLVVPHGRRPRPGRCPGVPGSDAAIRGDGADAGTARPRCRHPRPGPETRHMDDRDRHERPEDA